MSGFAIPDETIPQGTISQQPQPQTGQRTSAEIIGIKGLNKHLCRLTRCARREVDIMIPVAHAPAFTSSWSCSPLPHRRPRVRFSVCCCERSNYADGTHPPTQSRRGFLTAAAALSAAVAAPALSPSPAHAFRLAWPSVSSSRKSGDAVGDGLTIYQVKNLENVTLSPVATKEALDDLASRNVNAIFLGEHHYSYIDHVLQARVLDALRQHDQQRPLAVGLEMVQQRFQPVLDAYIDKSIDELDLYLQTEWETRWVWPFEQYLPVMRAARRLSIPLVALSADSELLNQIKEAGGMAGAAEVFGKTAFKRLSSPDSGFQAYVNAAIVTSYASHVRAGLYSGRASFEAFYANRAVRDEAMASRCEEYLRTHPETLLVCLLGIDHVKFGLYAVPGRLARRVAERISAATANDKGRAQGTSGTIPKYKTILLNPSNIDAYDEKDGSLMLDLRARGTLPCPIADLLWFSPHFDASNALAQAKAAERRLRRLPPGARLPHVEELVFE